MSQAQASGRPSGPGSLTEYLKALSTGVTPCHCEICEGMRESEWLILMVDFPGRSRARDSLGRWWVLFVLESNL